MSRDAQNIRAIADIPELILLYGDSRDDAVQRAESAAREIIADRIVHRELPGLS
jgi:hypothetical protein